MVCLEGYLLTKVLRRSIRVTADRARKLSRFQCVASLLINHGTYKFQTGIILDLNRDGSIDFLDVLAFLMAFDSAAG